jgi:predicted transcriptional regulator
MALRISQSELDIMNVLWEKSPMAASEVVGRLENNKDWSSRTVKTLLSRLVEKGALSTEADGRRYLYTPLIAKDIYAARAAKSLSDRLFGGRAAPLVAHLAEGDGLTETDIQELEALLAKLKK